METNKTKESAFDRVIFSTGVLRQRWHNDGALNNACVISLTLLNCLSWSLMISRIQWDQVENVFSFVCSGERLGWLGAGCGAAGLWGVLSGCRVTLKALWGLMGSPPWAPVVAQSGLTWRRSRPKERNPVSHLEGWEGLNGKFPIWSHWLQNWATFLSDFEHQRSSAGL